MIVNKLVLLSVVAIFLVTTISGVHIAEAKIAEGMPRLDIGSDKVCGDEICIIPMDTQEKIDQYLQDIETNIESDSPGFSFLDSIFGKVLAIGHAISEVVPLERQVEFNIAQFSFGFGGILVPQNDEPMKFSSFPKIISDTRRHFLST